MRGVSQYGISSGLGNAWLRYTERNERSLKELYLRAWDMRAAAWLVATAALGLSAGIISKKPGGPLVVAAAYNLCAASLQILKIFGPSLKPISTTNVRPPIFYLAFLSALSMMWPAAFGLMFAMRTKDDSYAEIDDLDGVTMSLAVLGIVEFILCLLQWLYMWRIHKRKFTEQEIQEVYNK